MEPPQKPGGINPQRPEQLGLGVAQGGLAGGVRDDRRQQVRAVAGVGDLPPGVARGCWLSTNRTQSLACTKLGGLPSAETAGKPAVMVSTCSRAPSACSPSAIPASAEVRLLVTEKTLKEVAGVAPW